MNKEKLIKKWNDYRKYIINPDGLASWDDLGFDEAPEGFDSVDEYLENGEESEFDEREQVELEMVDKFLKDLKKLD